MKYEAGLDGAWGLVDAACNSAVPGLWPGRCLGVSLIVLPSATRRSRGWAPGGRLGAGRRPAVPGVAEGNSAVPGVLAMSWEHRCPMDRGRLWGKLMPMVPLDQAQLTALSALCRHYHVRRLELFGSYARDEARPDSDVDLLVSFEAEHVPGFGFMQLALDLEALFGRPVDLLVREDAATDRNPIRREAIFSRTELLYAA